MDKVIEPTSICYCRVANSSMRHTTRRPFSAVILSERPERLLPEIVSSRSPSGREVEESLFILR